jgi:FdhD protein
VSKARFQGLRKDGTRTETVHDWLSVEAPLQININRRPFTITMRTPGDDACLVKGLLFTEGVVRPEGLAFTFDAHDDPRNPVNTIAEVSVPEVYLCDQLLEKRSLLSNSSCGICGKRELEDIALDGTPLVPRRPFPLGRLPEMAEAMRARQTFFTDTGGCHAAAAFTGEGRLLALFEDVGRHNAVDKVIGRLITDEALPSAELIFVSGRVSFEIVSKAFRGGIPIVAGVSAPSSLAVQMAQQCGMTVLGFCRGDRATAYSNPANVAIP